MIAADRPDLASKIEEGLWLQLFYSQSVEEPDSFITLFKKRIVSKPVLRLLEAKLKENRRSKINEVNRLHPKKEVIERRLSLPQWLSTSSSHDNQAIFSLQNFLNDLFLVRAEGRIPKEFLQRMPE